MMKQRLLPLFLSGIFLLWGCSSQARPGSTATPQGASPAATRTAVVSTAASMQQQWLEKQTCAPPCWEGIVPGTTTISETLRILQAHPRITDVKFEQGPLSSDITWTWDDNDPGGIITVNTVNDPTNNVVHMTSLYFEVPFNALVAAYGYPSAVSATSDSNPGSDQIWYSIRFIYEREGLFLNAVLLDKNQLSDTMLLEGPHFFSSAFQVEDLALGNVPKLIPWQGMQSFDFYCRDKDTFQPCEP